MLNASYRAIAQVPSPVSSVPDEITQSTPTDPYTRVRLVYDQLSDESYILRWQSQYFNQDQPLGRSRRRSRSSFTHCRLRIRRAPFIQVKQVRRFRPQIGTSNCPSSR